VHAHDKSEHILDGLQQVFTVVDVDVEFSLNRVVNQNASFNIKLVVFTVPMGLESDRYSIPPVGVDVPQTISTHSDDALCEKMRLLVQMNVVRKWVVESHL